MKRFLPLLLLITSSMFSMGQAPPFEITNATDSTWGALCTAPQQIEFIAGGNAWAFDPFGTDTVWLNVNFGDGNNATVATYLWGDLVGANFFGSISHTYQSPGNYTVQYIAYGSTNGVDYADTLIVVDEIIISDTCGTVEGLVYLDANSNCMFDPGEEVLPNTYVNIQNNGQWMGADYTDANGEYHFEVPVNLTYDVELYTQGFTNVCPAVVQNVTTVPSSGNDFGVYCDTVQFDLAGALSGWAFRPGLIGYLSPHVWNNGCLPQDGTIKLLLDPLVTFVYDWPQNALSWSGDTAIIDFAALSSYNWQSEWFSLGLMVDSTAIIDSLVCFEMWVCPENGDGDITNNYVNQCFPIVNSWDPNDKQVLPVGIGEFGAIGQNEWMTYTVRFQNTGTAEAFNVNIMDTIDANLDMSTFSVISASHDMDVYFPGENVVKFDFPNINLPDSTTNEPESHGAVMFTIRQNQDLPHGTVLNNTGHIYFDINPAVVTNTTINTIDLTVSIGPIKEVETVQFYPNPAAQSITIVTEEVGSALSVFDMSGRRVLARMLTNGNNSVDISQLNNGSYVLRVDANGKVAMSKLMKMEK